MDNSALRVSDDAAKAVQQTPLRISLDYMKSRITEVYFTCPEAHPHMTLCVIELDNGYLLVGKSVPADPENYDKALGEKFAYEDALRQAWPLFAFALRENITGNDVKADLEREAGPPLAGEAA